MDMKSHYGTIEFKLQQELIEDVELNAKDLDIVLKYLDELNKCSVKELHERTGRIEKEKNLLLQRIHQLASIHYRSFVDSAQSTKLVTNEYEKLINDQFDEIKSNEMQLFEETLKKTEIGLLSTQKKKLTELLFDSDKLFILVRDLNDIFNLINLCVRNYRFDEMFDLINYLSMNILKQNPENIVSKHLRKIIDKSLNFAAFTVIQRLASPQLSLSDSLRNISLLSQLNMGDDEYRRRLVLQTKTCTFLNRIQMIENVKLKSHFIEEIRMIIHSIFTHYKVLFATSTSNLDQDKKKTINESNDESLNILLNESSCFFEEEIIKDEKKDIVFASWMFEFLGTFLIDPHLHKLLVNDNEFVPLNDLCYLNSSLGRIGFDLSLITMATVEHQFKVKTKEIIQKAKSDIDSYLLRNKNEDPGESENRFKNPNITIESFPLLDNKNLVFSSLIQKKNVSLTFQSKKLTNQLFGKYQINDEEMQLISQNIPLAIYFNMISCLFNHYRHLPTYRLIPFLNEQITEVTKHLISSFSNKWTDDRLSSLILSIISTMQLSLINLTILGDDISSSKFNTDHLQEYELLLLTSIKQLSSFVNLSSIPFWSLKSLMDRSFNLHSSIQPIFS
ncbi:hypothetical protein SNEBB_001076 [Seison nebaliae]|nr:hypothetical protein SNEBB_001076 [Seison nebaliae]